MNGEKTLAYRPERQAPKLVAIFGGTVREFMLSGRQTLGRPARDWQPDIAIPVNSVSRQHGEFLLTEEGCRYRDLGSTNGSRLNGRPLAASEFCTLQDGDALLIHGSQDVEREMDVTLLYMTGYRPEADWHFLPLTGAEAEIVVGRDEGLSLRDGAVSRRHASFFLASGGWAVIDHNSTNGVFVNNRRIDRPVYLAPMDLLRIAGYPFLFTGHMLIYQADDRAAPSTGELLSIHIVERNVWHRLKKQTLLKDIRLEIGAGSMVLILGGSGAGKTTFMNAVMGYEPAEGTILYGGTDIYDEYEQMKYQIGYVPQQDLLRLNDTVYDTLMNAARMRLPRGLTAAQYAQRVADTLRLLGLERESGSLAGKLSGGQRKRLSIAMEYIGNPSLFFLDEPDSGLDGIMARALMENLRSIADTGKIVMVISHAPDRAFELFDQVIVLAKDSRDNCGRLAFFGTPDEACRFFETQTLEGVVRRINRADEGGDGLAEHYIELYRSMGGL